MIWLAWRQFRAQAATVYAAVAAFAVVLAITGPRLLELPRADPGAVFDQLTTTDRYLYNAGLVLVAVAPAVVGAFWGAPMVARELEAGTHRLAWNQTVTRTRWLATKLSVTAAAAAAGVGALALAVSWWAEPLDGITGNTRGAFPARLTPVAFAMRGLVPVGYTVFALVLGVAIGLVLRRTVPAMAVTLAVFTVVQVAVPLWVRPYVVPPVRETVTIGGNLTSINLPEPGGGLLLGVTTGDRNDWILSNDTVDASGRVVDGLPSWVGDCMPATTAGGTGEDTAKDCLARLADLGYQQRVVYQPAHRFWVLQWSETGLFLVLAGLLAWFCFWWTRRRLT